MARIPAFQAGGRGSIPRERTFDEVNDFWVSIPTTPGFRSRRLLGLGFDPDDSWVSNPRVSIPTTPGVRSLWFRSRRLLGFEPKGFDPDDSRGSIPKVSIPTYGNVEDNERRGFDPTHLTPKVPVAKWIRRWFPEPKIEGSSPFRDAFVPWHPWSSWL